MAVLSSQYKQLFGTILITLLPLTGCGSSGSSSGSANSIDSSDFTLSIADQMTVENCSICHEFKNHDWAGCGDPVWEEEHKAVIICPIFVPEEPTEDPVYSDDPTLPSDGSGGGTPSEPKKPKKSPPPSNATCTLCHAYQGEPDCSNSAWKQQSPGHSAACPSSPPKKKKPNKKSLNGWSEVKDLALFLNGEQR